MAGARAAVTPDPEALAAFSAAMRDLRRDAGNPGYRDLSRRTGYGVTTLWEAANGRVIPTKAVTLAYVKACGGSAAEWERRWARLVAASRQHRPHRPVDGPAPSVPVPRQLPMDVFAFTGRAAELARLDELQQSTQGGGTSAVVISAVSGTAGVGKTALAVRWAHRAADRFPDGQLYIDLRGYDSEQPVQPTDVLAGWLRALGTGGADIPADLDERAARYRTLLAGRRMLIMLDNACEVGQVRPLLPGTGACFVLVTSRDSLSGLAVRDGARRIELDRLSPADGIELLRRLVGDRVDAEPDAAATLVQHCAFLPLALRIAAELAVARPAAPLSKLVAQLADERRRLDLLDAGTDEHNAVRAVFSWSYRRLSAAAAGSFRLLGLYPGPDIDVYAAAALAGTDLDTVRQILDTLVRAHLVEPVEPNRYHMHDLLRMYAAELGRAVENEPEQRAAITRLLHHYLSTATAAMDQLFPAERHRRPRMAAYAGPTPPLADAAQAQEWLDDERLNLISSIIYAADHGWPTHAGYLAATVSRYLETGAHYTDALTVHGHALRAAREHGDHYGETTAHLNLGAARYYLGQYEEASGHFRRAADGFRKESDHTAATRALTNLGVIDAQLGHYDRALSHYRNALALTRETGDQVQATLLVGWIGLELGRLGRHHEGIEQLRQALAAFRDIGFPLREAEVLTDLGQVHLWAGRYADVPVLTGQALAIERKIGNRYGEAHALNIQGEGQRAGGLLDEALASHQEALAIARDIGHREDHARALDGIAHVLHDTGDPDTARRYWVQALAFYSALKMPKADEIRARLDAMPEPADD